MYTNFFILIGIDRHSIRSARSLTLTWCFPWNYRVFNFVSVETKTCWLLDLWNSIIQWSTRVLYFWICSWWVSYCCLYPHIEHNWTIFRYYLLEDCWTNWQDLENLYIACTFPIPMVWFTVIYLSFFILSFLYSGLVFWKLSHSPLRQTSCLVDWMAVILCSSIWGLVFRRFLSWISVEIWWRFWN
jgi:hypothetical protein